MANRIVNTKLDPAIVTEKTTIIDPSTIAHTVTINQSLDPNAKKSVRVSGSKPLVGIIPPMDIQPDITFNTYVNTTVQNYLDSYPGAVRNALYANVADVARSVAYGNITGVPTFATESYVITAINNVVDGAPPTLNTLNELAASLANTSIPTQTGNSGKFLTTNGSIISWATVSGGAGGGVTSYNDLTNKPSIPTKTSDITNDSNFVTLTEMQNYVNGLINMYIDGGDASGLITIDGSNASEVSTTTIDGGNA